MSSGYLPPRRCCPRCGLTIRVNEAVCPDCEVEAIVDAPTVTVLQREPLKDMPRPLWFQRPAPRARAEPREPREEPQESQVSRTQTEPRAYRSDRQAE
jgi:hypothetical protein